MFLSLPLAPYLVTEFPLRGEMGGELILLEKKQKGNKKESREIESKIVECIPCYSMFRYTRIYSEQEV